MPATSASHLTEEAPGGYVLELPDGSRRPPGDVPAAFTIAAANEEKGRLFLNPNPYLAAAAFVRGEFDVHGDVISAMRFRDAWLRERPWPWAWTATLRFLLHFEHWFQTKARAARNIRFHYDRPVEFYRQFLDSRLVYSCAYFQNPDWTLEQAQLAKLDLICRKLDLRPGELFLDVGCGWGALVRHAAGEYGAGATGCTVSPSQCAYARRLASQQGLENRVTIREQDYRDVAGVYHKIASVGMFEHVGRRRLGGYFRKMYELLAPDGLFLNHGIARAQGVREGPESRFVRRHVFPGGELVCLRDVVEEAESAGFEVLDVENLRPHYALTCRAWAHRLEANREACLGWVDAPCYRTWLVYLAASALNFEQGFADVYQVLLAKRDSARGRRLGREYMYALGAARKRAGFTRPGS